MSLRHFLPSALFLVALLVSCTDAAPDGEDLEQVAAQPNRDAVPGGLFHDFFEDGKYDAAGHPQGAEVFEGALRCAPETGQAGDLGIAAQVKRDADGVICGAETLPLGEGTFTLNARMLLTEEPLSADGEAATILEIEVFDDGELTASRAISAADFAEVGTEQDLALTFVHRGDSTVSFRVNWTGAADARLSYVEIFRATPRLVISPASQSLMPGAEPTFQIEMQDPPDDLSFEVWCDEANVTEHLTELLGTGEAEWVQTSFRTIVTAPASQLFEDCATPSRIKVQAMRNGWAQETSRVTYLAEPIPCDFGPEGENRDFVRVLLTGFEPFPADSDRDNSSAEAVAAYLAGPRPEKVAVMGAVLPVEYDAAPALIQDLITRCEPDVIIGFGQGRWAVDIETTAYNRKDSAAVAGGVPDNRGVVYGGDPIVDGGAPERKTALPVEAILTGLDTLGISAAASNDPGRYVCNNLFYTIMGVVADDPSRSGGFVHLPRIPHVDDTERETLRQTVATVVDASVTSLTASKTR